MQSQPLQHETHSCPRCSKRFVCLAGNISGCNCRQVALGDAARTYIAALFAGCLCNTCLLELNYEYDLIHPHPPLSNYDISD